MDNIPKVNLFDLALVAVLLPFNHGLITIIAFFPRQLLQGRWDHCKFPLTSARTPSLK
jgi:hypothetical protein